ncbi:hypothetical protein GR268_35960 [Rhizobium leguminosarum]|nr:hypothetical protein [Rhizobium leguminosarum]
MLMDVQFTPSMGVAGAFAGWSQVAREEKIGWPVFADVRVPSAQNEPNELIFAVGPASSCPQTAS